MVRRVWIKLKWRGGGEGKCVGREAGALGLGLPRSAVKAVKFNQGKKTIQFNCETLL